MRIAERETREFLAAEKAQKEQIEKSANDPEHITSASAD
jgi:hypothetical protein